MKERKLTPDQLHRLIDEVAELVDREYVFTWDIQAACEAAGCLEWWHRHGQNVYCSKPCGHAGLSAVLILLSEGG